MLISLLLAASVTGGGWTQVGACSSGACRWHEVRPVARAATVPVRLAGRTAAAAVLVGTAPVRHVATAVQGRSGCASGQCGVRRGLFRRR